MIIKLVGNVYEESIISYIFESDWLPHDDAGLDLPSI